MPILVTQENPHADYQHMGEGFASYLKRRRLQRGWTRPQAAQRLGIAVSYLEQIENGRRTTPTLPVIMALCQAYKVRPAAMLEAWKRGYDAQKAPDSR